jgi:hypothetical protein
LFAEGYSSEKYIIGFICLLFTFLCSGIFFPKDPSNFIKEEDKKPWCSQNL